MTSEQRIIFSEIYIDNHPKLLRYAKANKLCAPAAEELVQDTFHDASVDVRMVLYCLVLFHRSGDVTLLFTKDIILL